MKIFDIISTRSYFHCNPRDGYSTESTKTDIHNIVSNVWYASPIYEWLEENHIKYETEIDYEYVAEMVAMVFFVRLILYGDDVILFKLRWVGSKELEVEM